MSQFPLPPGYEEVLARRRKRRRYRRIALSTVLALLVGVIAVTGYQLLRGPDVGNRPSAAGTAADSAPPADCRGPIIELVLASAPETADLLGRLAADFSGAEGDGRCVQADVVGLDPGAAVEALAAAEWDADVGPQPDVWAPSSTTWVGLLADRLEQDKRPPLVDPDVSVPNLATSPTVVAMPRPMAEALGWPKEPIGWSDLRDLMRSAEGWGSAEHPEWGRFRFAMPSPLTSTAGLNATIALYSAAAPASGTLTPSDLRNTTITQFAGSVQRDAVLLSQGSSAALDRWAGTGTVEQAAAVASAVVTDEAALARYNAATPRVPLVAVYPAEGTLVADYPYVVLGGDWVTREKRSAAAAFASYLRSDAGREAFAADFYRDTDGTLAAENAADLGLDGAQPATVLDVPASEVVAGMFLGWKQSRISVNLLNLVDVSESMGNRLERAGATKLEAAQQATIASLDLYTDRDEIGLWSFAGGRARSPDHTVLVPIGPMGDSVDGTPRPQAIADALEAMRPSGKTGLYNAVSAAYAEVSGRSGPGRTNLIILITDGQNDSEDGLTRNELLAQIRQTPQNKQVRVMSIAYGPDADRDTLDLISEASGGETFVAPTPQDLPGVYPKILASVLQPDL